VDEDDGVVFVEVALPILVDQAGHGFAAVDWIEETPCSIPRGAARGL
jgi:hypothetical protein